ncbi:hypothetical protein C8J56DRAFT_941494, partial [Mycena floridula]
MFRFDLFWGLYRLRSWSGCTLLLQFGLLPGWADRRIGTSFFVDALHDIYRWLIWAFGGSSVKLRMNLCFALSPICGSGQEAGDGWTRSRWFWARRGRSRSCCWSRFRSSIGFIRRRLKNLMLDSQFTAEASRLKICASECQTEPRGNAARGTRNSAVARCELFAIAL